MSIRVVLADDEGLIRSALATLLPLEGDITVVADAGDGNEAVAAFRQHRPDVLVTDLEMPGLDGLDVASTVLQEVPDQPVVLLTRHARPGTLRSALKLGVRGFLSKHADPAVIAKILHLAPGTVRNYLSSAIGKTQTTTRHDAARYAREQG